MVTPRYAPSVGGIEESVRQTATGLRARGHTVRVHTLRLPGTPPSEVLNGVTVRRYAPQMQRGYYATRFEPQISGDVIHLHAWAHHTNDWVIRRFEGQIPIFLSTHHGARFPKDRLHQRVYHAVYSRLVATPNARRIQGLLVPTAYDALYFLGRRVDQARIHVVPSGADPAAFERHEPWAPPGVDARRGFLLFLGRLHEEKGVRDLLEAYVLSRPPVPLVFAGSDGGLAEELRQAAGKVPSVHVLTEFTDAQKWGLLAACRALVLPSRYEGQGIVVAEAWAAHRPVVATRAGALESVVEHGHDGLLVDLGDVDALGAAAKRIVEDEVLARRLGEAGRRKAERQYQWPRILTALEAIYSGRKPDDDGHAPA